MNRRDMIKNALLSAGALGAKVEAQAQETRRPEHHSFPSSPNETTGERMPNILWVCTDQQRFDTIQGLSNDVIRTPNLQKFMADSVTFTEAFVQCPICSPSRASFMSGRYPHVTGLRANGQRIRPTEQLVTRILADYDYTCGLSGKLHLSPCYGGRVEDRINDGYEVFHWSHDISDGWPLKNEWYVWLDRQGVKRPNPPGGHVWGMPIDPKFSQTGWCSDMAIQFIRQQREFNPWCFSVNIFQPHHPFFPTEEYLSHYDPAKMPNPAYKEGELSNKPIFQQVDHQGAYGGSAISFAKTSGEEHRQIIAAYYAMIEQVDTEIGRMVEVLDIAPTLLEAAGIPVPSGMQGRSLMPLLLGKTQEHRDSVYMEYFDANATFEIPPMLSCVRTAKWKLTLFDKPRTGELYDLEKDPGEVANLWNDPHCKDAQEMMLQNLVARMIETTDPLPERHTPWQTRQDLFRADAGFL